MKKAILLLVVIGILMFLSGQVNAQKQGKYENKALFAGISSGEITKDLLLGNGIINCDDPEFEVIYYSFSFVRKNGDLTVYSGRGNALTESMKAEIKGLEAGSKIVIDDIGARTTRNKIVQLQPIVLVLN
jgi:hypothetical protein